MQLNPKLKQLFRYKNFQDAASFLFGENFGTLAKDHLEAAEALKKSMLMANSQKVFRKATQSQGWQPVQWRKREPGW